MSFDGWTEYHAAPAPYRRAADDWAGGGGAAPLPPAAYPGDGTGPGPGGPGGYGGYGGWPAAPAGPAEHRGGVRDPPSLRERALAEFASPANLRRLAARLGRPVSRAEAGGFLPLAGEVIDADPLARRAWLAGRGGRGAPVAGPRGGAPATLDADERYAVLARARNDPERPFVGQRRVLAARARRWLGEEVARGEDLDWWGLGEQ